MARRSNWAAQARKLQGDKFMRTIQPQGFGPKSGQYVVRGSSRDSPLPSISPARVAAPRR